MEPTNKIAYRIILYEYLPIVARLSLIVDRSSQVLSHCPTTVPDDKGKSTIARDCAEATESLVRDEFVSRVLGNRALSVGWGKGEGCGRHRVGGGGGTASHGGTRQGVVPKSLVDCRCPCSSALFRRLAESDRSPFKVGERKTR